MFSPKLYTVSKFPLSHIIENEYSVNRDSKFTVKQQDNMLFRIVRNITKRDDFKNKFVAFVECDVKGDLRQIVEHGFCINGIKFLLSERSASMTRNGILSFVDSGIYEMVNDAITMDIRIEKTSVSKYLAYRGLMFSSCHMLEGYIPKIIVVKDYMSVIKDQKIRYLVDDEIEFIDKEGRERTWSQKKVVDGVKDITINCFDGSCIHHPSIGAEIASIIGIPTVPTSFLLRAPYIKGLSSEVNYTKFFKERDVDFIEDIWGKWHSVEDKMIILTESMYKGIKYFDSWDTYWDKFNKYNHCIGVAKWNFSPEDEPVYTRANYQILQDLKMEYSEFRKLSGRTLKYYEDIMTGDKASVYTFLGLRADKQKEMNMYMRSLMKSDKMINEECTRAYFKNLLNKKIDEAKCGKLYVDGCFKFLVPDLIAFMEYVGGIEVNGFLEGDEFWSKSRTKNYDGEYLIERNPHLSHSEHTILKYKRSDISDEYVGHLNNVCMINVKSIVTARLNGADFDGDLVLVIDEPVMMSGVDRDVYVTMDTEDKALALSEPVSIDTIYNVIVRNMDNRIGDYSNYATCYHNKMVKSDEQRDKYTDYISLLSVSTGKEIDKSKTGVSFPLPKMIVKYAKPLPYFMKYASPYYMKLLTWNKTSTNMNRMCVEIEKWQKKMSYSRASKFEYDILIDSSVEYTEEEFRSIEAIYIAYTDDMKELRLDQYRIQHYDKYKDYVQSAYNMTKKEASQFCFDWEYYKNKVKQECIAVVPNQKKLANIAVTLCYKKYPKKKKNFMWTVASEGIMSNLKSEMIEVPMRDEEGDVDILGRKFRMVKFLYVEEGV